MGTACLVWRSGLLSHSGDHLAVAASGITMDELEGYVLEGGVPDKSAYEEDRPPVDVKGEEDGTIIGVWSAVALGARRCRTTKKGGPDWNDVVLRMTRDAESGEEIERLEDASAILSKALLYR